MSGQRLILIMAIGVLLIAGVTLTLYFLTRQIDDGEAEPGFSARIERVATPPQGTIVHA